MHVDINAGAESDYFNSEARVVEVRGTEILTH